MDKMIKLNGNEQKLTFIDSYISPRSLSVKMLMWSLLLNFFGLYKIIYKSTEDICSPNCWLLIINLYQHPQLTNHFIAWQPHDQFIVSLINEPFDKVYNQLQDFDLDTFLISTNIWLQVALKEMISWFNMLNTYKVGR